MSLYLEYQPPNLSDYFDSFCVTVTPDNRVLPTKKPHRVFHKKKDISPKLLDSRISELSDSSNSRLQSFLAEKLEKKADPLASHLNDKSLKSDDFKVDSTNFQTRTVIPSPMKNTVPPVPTPKKFTRLARHTILCAAGALEKEGYLPEQFYFFTATLPGSSQHACEGLSRFSPYIVNRLKQHLRDKGIYISFNTWEWQQREKVRGSHALNPALHLHLVFAVPSNADYSWLPEYLKQKWFDILDDIKTKGFNLYQVHKVLGGGSYSRDSKCVQEKCCKTIRCEKSPAAYLSKYVGKASAKDLNQIKNYCKQNNLTLYYPSTWWSISKNLRDLISKHTHTFSVRIPCSESQPIWNEITQFLSENSVIQQKKFSPEAYPDYWYQGFYISPDDYDSIVKKLELIFIDYKQYFGVRDNAALPYSPNFDDVLRAWFHLPINRSLRDQFLSSLPFYYKKEAIDFYSPTILHKLRKFYFQNVKPERDFKLSN